LAFNPLVLIETVSSIHNDVLMMGPAVGAILCGYTALRRRSWRWGVASLGLLLISVSIKFASVMLIAGGAGYWLTKKWRYSLSLGAWQGGAHFIPLLTERSQQFLPWYLIWSLTFLPWMREQWGRMVLISFSFTSLLSYLPFLLSGEYSPQSDLWRKIILFVPPISLGITNWIMSRWVLMKTTD